MIAEVKVALLWGAERADVRPRLLNMHDLFRDYGSAIGPTLAFILSLVAKYLFDNVFARRQAEGRLKTIAAMVRQMPPPSFEEPEEGSEKTSAMIRNMVNFSAFFDNMLAVKGALELAEKTVHEHGRPAAIIRFQRMRENLDFIMNETKFVRKPDHGSPIPEGDNFFNIKQGWNGLLKAADGKVASVQYQLPSTAAGRAIERQG